MILGRLPKINEVPIKKSARKRLYIVTLHESSMFPFVQKYNIFYIFRSCKLDIHIFHQVKYKCSRDNAMSPFRYVI